MKAWQFCLIMSLVALAPAMSTYMCIAVGIGYFILAFIALVLNK